MTLAAAMAIALGLASAAPGIVVGPAPVDGDLRITADDYPAEALRYRMQGIVDFQLDIDVDGNVAACRVTRSSGYALLDATTCRLLRERGRYRLLRDEHSKPLPFVVHDSMAWRLPADEPGRERPVRFAGTPGTTICLADYDGRAVTLPAPACTEITAAARTPGHAPDAPVRVWLADALGAAGRPRR